MRTERKLFLGSCQRTIRAVNSTQRRLMKLLTWMHKFEKHSKLLLDLLGHYGKIQEKISFQVLLISSCLCLKPLSELSKYFPSEESIFKINHYCNENNTQFPSVPLNDQNQPKVNSSIWWDAFQHKYDSTEDVQLNLACWFAV